MKRIIIIALLIPLASLSQDTASHRKAKPASKMSLGLGIKGGFNFANVTKASSINGSNQTGFLIGVFMAPPSKSIMSYRTELTFSRQGYNYSTGTNTGTVNLNYLMFPQLMGINITKYVQLQIGMQMAYLLNAKADSSKPAGGSNPYESTLDYFNRFDYGAAAGIEVFPIKWLLVGARYNISFGNMYKDMATEQPGTAPPFIPDVNLKNNLVQLYVGLRF